MVPTHLLLFPTFHLLVLLLFSLGVPINCCPLPARLGTGADHPTIHCRDMSLVNTPYALKFRVVKPCRNFFSEPVLDRDINYKISRFDNSTLVTILTRVRAFSLSFYL